MYNAFGKAVFNTITTIITTTNNNY